MENIKDFPGWFVDFVNKQLCDYEDADECFENMTLAELQVAYIKIWSVIEGFAKITHILASKRNFLRELEPEIDTIKSLKQKLTDYENKLKDVVDFHRQSIGGTNKNVSLNFDAINAVKIELKKKKSIKFSVAKNVVFKGKLPNKENIDEAFKGLGLDIPEFSALLNNDGKPSKFYTTRNKIAHEGAVVVQIKTLKNERLLPILAMAKKIEAYIEAEVMTHE